MIRKRQSNFISTSTLLFLIFVHAASCEELTNGTVAESSGSGSGSQSMPADVTVNVTVGGQEVRLQLKVDQEANTDVPVYVFSNNKDGKLETTRVKLNKTGDFDVYLDVTQGAAFTARRDVDESGQDYLTLEGMVQVGGKMYDLKSTGRRYRNSSDDAVGRDASLDQENTMHAQVHDLQRRDVSEKTEARASSQNEAGERHEFVVRQRDDLLHGALQGDAIPAPTAENKKVEMTGFKGAELQPPPPPPVRIRRQSQKQNVYIDVLAVTDYAIFSDWYSRSSATTDQARTSDALNNIRQYYAFVYSGMNMLYENITSSPYNIHVKLAAITVATRPGDSSWTESRRQKASPRDTVDANAALNNFSSWAASTDTLPSYDHLTLFTGYDLTKTDTLSSSNTITGLAFTGTLCLTTGKSSSVVEDHGGFQSMFTSAHELGHSLSAEHDGTQNSCSGSDQYIMAAVSTVKTATDKLNPWRFSPCSVNYFNTYISETLTSLRGQQCLNNALTSSATVPDVSFQQPGQVYDYDAQCRQVYGPLSRMCRGPEFYQTSADICTTMYCDDRTTNSSCTASVAARGTSCGNRKWCVSGQCVYDTQAPSVDENCPFGDQPGIAFHNLTCAEFVSGYPAYCYQAVVVGRCCSSCANNYNPVQNCEYGDKALGCVTAGCSSRNPDYPTTCCGTCKYGTPITTSSTTVSTKTSTSQPSASTTIMESSSTTPLTSSAVSSSTATRARTTTSSTLSSFTSKISTTSSSSPLTTPTTVSSITTPLAATTASNSSTTPQTLTTTTPAPGATATTWPFSNTFTSTPAMTTTTQIPGGCLDNATTSSVCLKLFQAPYLCYNDALRQQCCGTCGRVANGWSTGCPYGDRHPGRCTSDVINELNCKNGLETICCQSCAQYVGGALTVYRGVHWITLVMCALASSLCS